MTKITKDENVKDAGMVPSTWDGALTIYTFSKRVVFFNLGTLLWLYVGTGILSGITQTLPKEAFLAQILVAILTVITGVASIFAFLAGLRQEKISLGEAIEKTVSIVAVKYVLLSILLLVIAALSFVAFIIPFFFVLPRIALSPYFLISRNLGVVDSIKESWEETKGHSMKVWGVIGVTILFGLLSVILIGIYLLFVYSAAFAVLYAYITSPGTSAELSKQ